MNIASALIKQVLAFGDFETWSNVRQHYLPPEYHSLYSIIERHCEKYHRMPSFDDLAFEIRDSSTKEKLYAIQGIEIEVDPYQLLEYLKNEYTQKYILDKLEDYVERTVAFEDANESVAQLHEIIVDVEERVDLKEPEESMQRIELFDDDEALAKYLPLGLNADFDEQVKFAPTDLILLGGRRGSGKSLTCSNISVNAYTSGRSSLYFTIEMPSRQILQRCCSIATGIPHNKIKRKLLSVKEWEEIASWWSNRFEGGEDILRKYKTDHDFNELHKLLATKCKLKDTQIDVVYDSALTLSKIRTEVDKKVKQLDIAVVVVDYLNQVKRSAIPNPRKGQYDWTEQIEVSKALKEMAQEYEIPFVAPYQVDNSGEARFSKGILDAADAAYSLEAYTKEDRCITFTPQKMRDDTDELEFTSEIDWGTLKIGPKSVLSPKEREETSEKTGEEIDDTPW